jgi:Flp pilus assembly protein TadG
MRCRNFRARNRRRIAAAAIECALVMPLLVSLLLGVWELGQAIHIYQIVSNAAREGARQASSAKYTNDQVKEVVFDYLKRANVPLSDTLPNSSVTMSNTNAVINVSVSNASGDAFDADQFVPMTVNVSLPSKNVRWLLASVFLASNSNISASAGVLCLKDVPIDVNSTIPQAPLQ